MASPRALSGLRPIWRLTHPAMSQPVERTQSMRLPRVWKRPTSIGEGEAIKGMGGIVAPLLAGFSLATVGVLATSYDPSKTPLATWSLLCLSSAAVAFLYVMQYSFLAVRSGSPPSSYLDWEQGAARSRDCLTRVRREQAADRRLFDIFNKRCSVLYDAGVLFFLAGLALVVVPVRWETPNVAALVVLAGAFLVEFLWALSVIPSLSDPLRPIMSRLAPTRADVQAEVDANVDDDLDTQELRQLGLLL